MASGGLKPGAAFLVLNSGIPVGSYSNVFRKRDGAANDQDNIQYVFMSLFGFELVNKHKTINFYRSDWNHKYNPTKRECPKEAMCMVCLIKQTDYSSYEHILFHISSEGYCDDGGGMTIQFLSDSNKEFIPLAEIVETFNDTNCPGLKGKTRILIIQACRQNPRKLEEADDTGVDTLVDEEKHIASEEAGITQNNSSGDEAEQNEPEPLLPTHEVPEDFLIVYSTTKNRFAKRNTQTGSWFEAELRNAVDALRVRQDPSQRQDMDFLNILTETADRVARKETRSQNPNECRKKNVPCFEHRLTNQVIFRCLQ